MYLPGIHIHVHVHVVDSSITNQLLHCSRLDAALCAGKCTRNRILAFGDMYVVRYSYIVDNSYVVLTHMLFVTHILSGTDIFYRHHIICW